MTDLKLSDMLLRVVIEVYNFEFKENPPIYLGAYPTSQKDRYGLIIRRSCTA